MYTDVFELLFLPPLWFISAKATVQNGDYLYIIIAGVPVCLLFVISVIFYASVLSMYCWRLVDTLLISVLCPIHYRKCQYEKSAYRLSYHG